MLVQATLSHPVWICLCFDAVGGVLSPVQVIVFRIIFAQGLLRRPWPRTAAAVD